jgi:hypothetical protein
MKFLITILALTLVSCVLHAAWERSHIVLYTAYEKMEGALPVYVFATLGDVAYTLLAYAVFALLKRDALWVRNAELSDFLLLAAAGFGVALFVEYKAFVLERWSYTPAMPIIPLLRVGLSPMVQMMLLLPLSVYLTKLITSSFR